MFHLPDYSKCLKICSDSETSVFYESKFILDGYDVSLFNYRIAQYSDFVNQNAFELRGLCFVFNNDGTVYRRFPLMEKFFNLNENESTQYEIIKGKKIKSVYQKVDGSIINFIELPNGKVFAKSKMSFDSDQAKQAQSIFETNKEINDFVTDCLNQDISPIFELIGPSNTVVVKYPKTELVLLRLRNNKTGEYLSLDDVDLKKSERFKFSLKDLMNLQTKLEGLEGWIVEFEDSQKIKIKTEWYLKLHRILTDYSNREDYLISEILDERIDDILSYLDYGSEQRLFVEKVIERTQRNFSDMLTDCDSLLSTWNGDRKSFAEKNYKHPYFGIVMSVVDGKNKYELIKEWIKKCTYRLSGARTWLNL